MAEETNKLLKELIAALKQQRDAGDRDAQKKILESIEKELKRNNTDDSQIKEFTKSVNTLKDFSEKNVNKMLKSFQDQKKGLELQTKILETKEKLREKQIDRLSKSIENLEAAEKRRLEQQKREREQEDRANARKDAARERRRDIVGKIGNATLPATATIGAAALGGETAALLGGFLKFSKDQGETLVDFFVEERDRHKEDKREREDKFSKTIAEEIETREQTLEKQEEIKKEIEQGNTYLEALAKIKNKETAIQKEESRISRLSKREAMKRQKDKDADEREDKKEQRGILQRIFNKDKDGEEKKEEGGLFGFLKNTGFLLMGTAIVGAIGGLVYFFREEVLGAFKWLTNQFSAMTVGIATLVTAFGALSFGLSALLNPLNMIVKPLIWLGKGVWFLTKGIGTLIGKFALFAGQGLITLVQGLFTAAAGGSLLAPIVLALGAGAAGAALGTLINKYIIGEGALADALGREDPAKEAKDLSAAKQAVADAKTPAEKKAAEDRLRKLEIARKERQLREAQENRLKIQQNLEKQGSSPQEAAQKVKKTFGPKIDAIKKELEELKAGKKLEEETTSGTPTDSGATSRTSAPSSGGEAPGAMPDIGEMPDFDSMALPTTQFGSQQVSIPTSTKPMTDAGIPRITETELSEAKETNKISSGQGQAALESALDQAGITDPQERAQFLGQMSHESMGFTRMLEMADGTAYEGKSRLGNTQPGDGPRFKGRGFVQLTGRYNYGKYGSQLGIDLINNPHLASDPKIAAKIAVAYWMDRVRPAVKKNGGDFSNTRVVTKAINGGFNGLEDRIRRVAKFQNGLVPGGGGGANEGPFALASAGGAATGAAGAGLAGGGGLPDLSGLGGSASGLTPMFEQALGLQQGSLAKAQQGFQNAANQLANANLASMQSIVVNNNNIGGGVGSSASGSAASGASGNTSADVAKTMSSYDRT
jgi:putative chitinase